MFPFPTVEKLIQIDISGAFRAATARKLMLPFAIAIMATGCANTNFDTEVPDRLLKEAGALEDSDFKRLGGCDRNSEMAIADYSTSIGGRFIEATSRISDDLSVSVDAIVTKMDDEKFRADWIVRRKPCEVAVLATDADFKPDFDYTWFGF